MNALLYFFPFLFVAFTTFGLKTGSFAVFFGFIILLVAHPFADNVARLPTPVFNEEDEDKNLYDFSLLLMPFILTGFLFGSVRLFDPSQPLFEIIGRILSTGVIMGGLGITVAHELVHRQKRWQRGLGVWLLNLVMFGHFRVEHVYIHHKDVATPSDVSTARLNENVYSFLARHFFGAWFNSWKYEVSRLSEKSFLAQVFQNRLTHYLIIQMIIAGCLFGFWGFPVLVFWVLQSFVAYFLLVIINYIEHYGLTRKETSPGVYEAQNESHTWDSDLNFTNISLFNLGLHAHHHKKAHLPYYQLESLPHARVLPYGYSLMLIIALVPPLFKKVMNPLVEAGTPQTSAADASSTTSPS